MSQQPSGGLTFPIKLRCASAADLMSEPGLEAALSRALGRAFARARAALPVPLVLGSGVALQAPRLVAGGLSGADATALLARVRGAAEAAARAQSIPTVATRTLAPVNSSRDRTDVEPVSSRGAERFGRERFEAESRTYNVPSYGGGTVDVPVAGQTPEQLKEQWQSAVEAWEETSKELPSAEQRARARRIFILLRLGTPLQFAVAAELDRFIDRCIQDGDNEDATLKWFSEAILLTEGAAFPKTWAWNVQKEFRFSTDLNGLERAIQSASSDVIGLSTYLSDDVWDHGLPLSLDEASTLTSGKLERMVLNSEAAKAPKKNTVITRYTQALLRLARAIAHHRLVHWYNWQIDVTIEHIRNGDQIVDQDEHDRLKAQQKGFALRRQAFEDAASSSSNTSKQVNAILFSYPDKFDRLNFTDWPGDEVQALRKSIADVDARIAQHGGLSGIAPVLPAAGLLPGIWRAAVWASERGYYGDVAVDVFEAIKQNPVESLAKLVAIIIAGEIPGLNIAVGLVLAIEFGIDAVRAAFDLAGALTEAGTAQSVVQMERASARLARTLVGTAADMALWAVTWGAAKGMKAASRKVTRTLADWRKVEKFVKTHGDNAETREALLQSKANVEQAEQILVKKREHERQLQQPKPRDKQETAPTPESSRRPGPDPKTIQGGSQTTPPRQGHLASVDLEGKLKKPSSSKRPPGGGPAPGGGPSLPASGRVANENVTPQPEANVRQKVAGAGHPPPTASPETVRRTVASGARGRRTPAQTPGPSTPRTGRATPAPTATPAPAQPSPASRGPRLLGELHPSDTRTAGTRGIASIERRINTVDNSQTVTITGEIRPALNRAAAPNYNTEKMWRILRQEHGLPDYQGAHLWGPGFGDEAAAGIMLAPRDVNLIWQSGRAEKFLREDLPDMAQAASRHFGRPVAIRLRAVATSHPGTVAGGAALKEVQYTFSIAADGQEVVLGRVGFSVGLPPRGKVSEVKVERLGDKW